MARGRYRCLGHDARFRRRQRRTFGRLKYCVFRVNVCLAATGGGHLKTLIHLDVLRWAREEQKCCWDSEVTARAAAVGHVGVLKYAVTKGCRWGTKTCANAARHGRLDALKTVGQASWNAITCAPAAARGHLDDLRWARAWGSKAPDKIQRLS